MPEDNLNVGLELEFPVSQESEATYDRPATDSYDVHNEFAGGRYNTEPLPHHIIGGGELTWDGTVGAEAVTPNGGLPVDDASMWYDETLAFLQGFAPFEPTGVGSNSSSISSTVGLHTHISPLTRAEARALYELSLEPWMKVFVCTSIAEESAAEYHSVFRGEVSSSYANTNFNEGRYSVINRRTHVGVTDDGEDLYHWEWRLPEPMTRANLNTMLEFLRRFKHDGADEARTYAKDLVDSADSRLTAIERADKVGLGMTEPDQQPGVYTATRHPDGAGSFYNAVRESDDRPYITCVETPEDGSYYAFYTRSYDDQRTFANDGVEFTPETVLDMDDLSPVTGDLADNVRQAVQEAVDPSPSRGPTTYETDATEYIKDVLA